MDCWSCVLGYDLPKVCQTLETTELEFRQRQKHRLRLEQLGLGASGGCGIGVGHLQQLEARSKGKREVRG